MPALMTVGTPRAVLGYDSEGTSESEGCNNASRKLGVASCKGKSGGSSGERGCAYRGPRASRARILHFYCVNALDQQGRPSIRRCSSASRRQVILRARPHYRITVGDILQAHEKALEFGGTPGVLDMGRIEAAAARPYAGYNRSLASKAAALLQSLVTNHGFLDGNKRTAVVCVFILVDRSGWRFSDGRRARQRFENLILHVAKHNPPVKEIEDWFVLNLERIRPRQSRID